MTIYGFPVVIGYILVFGVAALACVIGLYQAVGLEDAATRRGLTGLLLGSGGWALFALLFFVVPGPLAKHVVYSLSLAVGLSTVGAWLYFCSAYTGRTYHRKPLFRRTAVAVYLTITAVKLTNPLHELYFAAQFQPTPFPHLAIQHQPIHWVVSGLSYALIAVGFFMLYELFLETGYDTRPLAALVAVTGLPVVLNLIGITTPTLLNLNYEPIGVAVFAVGVLYVFDQRFMAVQLTSDLDNSVILLDGDDRVREYNTRAATLFPELTDAVGKPLSSALPDVVATLRTDQQTLRLTRDGEVHHYHVSETAFTQGQAGLGRIIVLTDVTATEQQRQQIVRQDDSLESLASAIRHELRNSLNVIDGNVNEAGRAIQNGDITAARDALQTVSTTSDNMASVVNDLANLAQYSQTVKRTEPVEIGATARSVFETIDPEGMSLTVQQEGTVQANPDQLRELFENAFRFAARTDVTVVTVTLTGDQLTISTDGDPLHGMNTEQSLNHGTAVPSAEAGRFLPNLEVLANAHGWDVTLENGSENGLRVVITGLRVQTHTRTAD